MNVHQMLRYLDYRHRDALRACKTEGFNREVAVFIDKLFKDMKEDIKEVW